MIEEVRKHELYLKYHLSLVEVTSLRPLRLETRCLGVRALVCIYLYPKMPYIIHLNFLLTIPDHESSSIEFQIFFIDGRWQNIVMIQIFLFSLLRVILLSRGRTYHLVRSIR